MFLAVMCLAEPATDESSGLTSIDSGMSYEETMHWLLLARDSSTESIADARAFVEKLQAIIREFETQRRTAWEARKQVDAEIGSMIQKSTQMPLADAVKQDLTQSLLKSEQASIKAGLVLVATEKNLESEQARYRSMLDLAKEMASQVSQLEERLAQLPAPVQSDNNSAVPTSPGSGALTHKELCPLCGRN